MNFNQHKFQATSIVTAMYHRHWCLSENLMTRYYECVDEQDGHASLNFLHTFLVTMLSNTALSMSHSHNQMRERAWVYRRRHSLLHAIVILGLFYSENVFIDNFMLTQTAVLFGYRFPWCDRDTSQTNPRRLGWSNKPIYSFLRK